MDFHILDFILYFVLLTVVDRITPHAFRFRKDREVGAIFGLLILILYSIFYILIFTFFLDWVDIWDGLRGNLNFKL